MSKPEPKTIVASHPDYQPNNPRYQGARPEMVARALLRPAPRQINPQKST